jgi:cysteine desulfurase/selenocysteine lyase
MKIDQSRKDFPILVKNKWIYFDNACQSLRPQSVINAVTEYYQEYPACSGRSMHSPGGQGNPKV